MEYINKDFFRIRKTFLKYISLLYFITQCIYKLKNLISNSRNGKKKWRENRNPASPVPSFFILKREKYFSFSKKLYM